MLESKLQFIADGIYAEIQLKNIALAYSDSRDSNNNDLVNPSNDRIDYKDERWDDEYDYKLLSIANNRSHYRELLSRKSRTKTA